MTMKICIIGYSRDFREEPFDLVFVGDEPYMILSKVTRAFPKKEKELAKKAKAFPDGLFISETETRKVMKTNDIDFVDALKYASIKRKN